MVALGKRQQHLPPVPQRRDLRRDRTERRQRGERRPRLVRPAELQQRQRTSADASGAAPRLSSGSAGAASSSASASPGAFLLQQVGGEVEPRAGIVGRAGEAVAQQRFGRLGFAGDAHEGAEIGGGGADGRAPDASAWRIAVLASSICALAIAGDAEIDPGIRPTRRQSKRGGESALGVAMIAQCRPGFSIGVMSLRPIRRGVAGVARRLERGQRLGSAETVGNI